MSDHRQTMNDLMFKMTNPFKRGDLAECINNVGISELRVGVQYKVIKSAGNIVWLQSLGLTKGVHFGRFEYD